MKNSALTEDKNIKKKSLKLMAFLMLILGFPCTLLAADDGFPRFKVVGEGFFCYQAIEKAMKNADKDAHMKAAFICQKSSLKMKKQGVPIIKINKDKCQVTSEIEFSCVK